MVALPTSDGFFNIEGKSAGDRSPLPGQQADGKLSPKFGVPQGCIVRNTFLEWQDYGDSSKGQEAIDSDDSTSFGVESLPSSRSMHYLRKSRSCPGEVFVAGVVEAYINPDSSPDNSTVSGNENALAEEDDADDGDRWESLRTSSTPWRRRGLRVDLSQEESWKSPTSGGRSLKSRKEDRDIPKSGKGKCNPSTNPLVLRGLPFTVTEAELTSFIEEAGAKDYLAPVAKPINLLSNTQGRPSGFAELHLAKSADFWEVRDKLHMQYFGNRYIEVLPHRRENLPTIGGRSGHDRNRSWRR
jgi:hypothetical protein